MKLKLRPGVRIPQPNETVYLYNDQGLISGTLENCGQDMWRFQSCLPSQVSKSWSPSAYIQGKYKDAVAAVVNDLVVRRLEA